MESKHKPIIETIINTTALALSAFAVTQLTNNYTSMIDFWKCLILLLVAMGLEYFKYIGRQKQLW